VALANQLLYQNSRKEVWRQGLTPCVDMLAAFYNEGRLYKSKLRQPHDVISLSPHQEITLWIVVQ
jgi:hypothetical protein